MPGRGAVASAMRASSSAETRPFGTSPLSTSKSRIALTVSSPRRPSTRADLVAERHEPLLHGADHLLGVGGSCLRRAGGLEAGGGAEQDAFQQRLARLAGQRQAVVVLVGHDGGARADADDAVAGEGAVAARVELALDGRDRLGAGGVLGCLGSAVDARGVRRKARDPERSVGRARARPARAGLVATGCLALLARGIRRALLGDRPLRPRGGGRPSLQEERVECHACRDQQKDRQRDASLPWGHYPYSRTHAPSPKALFESLSKRTVNRLR